MGAGLLSMLTKDPPPVTQMTPLSLSGHNISGRLVITVSKQSVSVSIISVSILSPVIPGKTCLSPLKKCYKYYKNITAILRHCNSDRHQ